MGKSNEIIQKLMKKTKLKKIIKQNENPKLDFKRDYEEDKENSDYISDIISIANGNENNIGETGYLIFGIKEQNDSLQHKIYGVENKKGIQEINRHIVEKLNNHVSPKFSTIEIYEFFLNSKRIIVIEIPFHENIFILKKDIKKTRYKKNNFLYRIGEGIQVIEEANDSKQVEIFQKKLKNYAMKKKILNFLYSITGTILIVIGIMSWQEYMQSNHKKLDNSTKESVLFTKWDDEKAKKIIENELSKYEKIKENNFGFKNKIHHSIIKFSELNDINYLNPKRVAIIETSDYQWCHACGVKLSFIEFIHVSSGWILGQVDINVMSAGSWGENNDEVNVLSIGKNKFGISIEGFYGNQGTFSDYFTLYTLIAGEYEEIFLTETSTNNAGAVGEGGSSYFDWNATISFEHTQNKYYKLNLLKQGIRDNKKFKEKIIYEFDGIKYKEIKKLPLKL